MLTQAIESLIVRAIELHLPGEPMLLLLRHRIARLHTKFSLRYGEVPELLSVLGFLQQLVAIGIEEGDLTRSFLYHGLDVLRLNHYCLTLVFHCITALLGSRLGHNHQRSRFLRQIGL